MSADSNKRPIKKISTNRKARHEYHVEDTVVAGIELVGIEVKSIRANKINMEDAFADLKDGEIFLHNLHISPYDKAGYETVDPMRKRKLLLKKMEIQRLEKKIQLKGYTLIPLDIFLSGPWVKITIGICIGKKHQDKREDLKKKDHQRDMERGRKGKWD